MPRYVPPASARPAPLPTAGRTKREWKADRAYLDLDRQPPIGAPTLAQLAKIDAGLFYAWNKVQCRWELWCSREDSGQLPYFVLRVASHPPNRKEDGQLIVCPGRPVRQRRQPQCSPSCVGVYRHPGGWLLSILYQGSIRHGFDPVAAMDALEAAEAEEVERDRRNALEGMVGDHFNQLVGIPQVGYTAPQKAS